MEESGPWLVGSAELEPGLDPSPLDKCHSLRGPFCSAYLSRLPSPDPVIILSHHMSVSSIEYGQFHDYMFVCFYWLSLLLHMELVLGIRD